MSNKFNNTKHEYKPDHLWVNVIIPNTIKPYPEKHEVEVAWIVAKHFKFVVEFLQPRIGYRMKTPDIVMNGVMWEIKSPTGFSKKYTV